LAAPAIRAQRSGFSSTPTAPDHHEAGNNPAAKQIEDLTFDGTAGAVFEIPADLITFRSGHRRLSPERALAAAANLERVRRAA
jgi:hypothetical protein